MTLFLSAFKGADRVVQTEASVSSMAITTSWVSSGVFAISESGSEGKYIGPPLGTGNFICTDPMGDIWIVVFDDDAMVLILLNRREWKTSKLSVKQRAVRTKSNYSNIR